MSEEISLAVIVASERMGPLDNPIHVIRNMGEEPFPIS